MHTMWINFRRLLMLAVQARDRAVAAAQGQPGSLSDDALVAVILTTAGLEAFINELSIMANRLVQIRMADGNVPPVPDYVESFAFLSREAVDGKATVALKYQLAAAVLRGKPLDKGAQPYQDFHRLVTLRNWLIHLKSDPPRGVLEHLQAMGYSYSPPDGTRIDEMSRIATSRVAVWACDTARLMIEEILNLIPDNLDAAIGIIKLTFAAGE